jgi:hypothetical protein
MIVGAMPQSRLRVERVVARSNNTMIIELYRSSFHSMAGRELSQQSLASTTFQDTRTGT